MRRLALLALIALTHVALAHEVRPAYLELRETAPEQYDVLWKVPALGENARLALHAELPGACTDLTPRRRVAAAGSFVERRTAGCAGGLSGGVIHIAGLSATLTDVLVRIEQLDGSTQVTRLSPDAPSLVVEAVPGRLQIGATYLKLGVEHILLGVDHLLFVFALLLLVDGTRRLVWTITAFTVAHSITLAGATLGLLQVPGPPVEACIALSIMFVAAEIVHGRRGQPGVTARWPWLVALVFGLLHGFGFAGALIEVGLPDHAIPLALLFFNIGVELGQLLFIAAALAGIAVLRRWSVAGATSGRGAVPVSYAIGSIAAFWVIERVASF
jgi:hydrogenase/urease accessory protein HupE